MLVKPWDCLRVPVTPPPPLVIGKGGWNTVDRYCNEVELLGLDAHSARLKIDSWFSSSGLRQIAEFCNELANQLDAE